MVGWLKWSLKYPVSVELPYLVNSLWVNLWVLVTLTFVPLHFLACYCRASAFFTVQYSCYCLYIFCCWSLFSISISSLLSVPICAVTMEHLPCGIHPDLPPRNEFIQKLLHLPVPDLLRLQSQHFLEASNVYSLITPELANIPLVTKKDPAIKSAAVKLSEDVWKITYCKPCEYWIRQDLWYSARAQWVLFLCSVCTFQALTTVLKNLLMSLSVLSLPFQNPVILMGDFNAHLPNTSPVPNAQCTYLLDFADRNHLYPVSCFTGPGFTFFADDSRSVVDYIFLDAAIASSVRSCEILGYNSLNLSDHSSISLYEHHWN